jgi:hypothetical protein
MKEGLKTPQESYKDILVPIAAIVLIFLILALFYLIQGDIRISILFTVLIIYLLVLAMVMLAMYLLLKWSSIGVFFWTMGLVCVLMAIIPGEGFPWPNRVAIFLLGASIMTIGYLARYFGRSTLSASTQDAPRSDVSGEETRPHSGTYSLPGWLEEGMMAIYHSETTISHYQVVPQQGNFLMKVRFVETDELAELIPELKDSGWSEESLSKWQEEYYGELFIDTLRDPSSHSIFGEETEYLGMEKVRFRGEPYNCIKLRTSHMDDCHCVRMAKHLLFYRGLGSCSKCGGILSSLRKCSECNGTGKCPSCDGKGKLHKIGYYWYEEKRGLLLRHEFFWWKKRVNVEVLQSLTPPF